MCSSDLRAAEPGLASLRVGDVVTYIRTDYVVEAVLSFDDDGQVTRLYRIADGNRVRWLALRAGDPDPVFLEEIAALEVAVDVNAPDQLTQSGIHFRLASRASTRVSLVGSLPRPPGDRAWFYDYAGAGRRRLFAIAWGDRSNGFLGESVDAGMFDILPGS